MKTYMCLIGLIILVSSCGNYDNVTIPKDEYNKLKGIPTPIKPEYPKPIKVIDDCNNPTVSVILVDGCEYIASSLINQNGIMCHKGNCKFCQHRQEETIRKIIQEELSKK